MKPCCSVKSRTFRLNLLLITQRTEIKTEARVSSKPFVSIDVFVRWSNPEHNNLSYFTWSSPLSGLLWLEFLKFLSYRPTNVTVTITHGCLIPISCSLFTVINSHFMTTTSSLNEFNFSISRTVYDSIILSYTYKAEQSISYAQQNVPFRSVLALTDWSAL